MPRPKCIDPEVLAQRKQRRRESGKARTRLYRERLEAGVGKALSGLLDGTTNPMPVLIAKQDQVPALAKRTAQSILKNSLLRHGVTLDRCIAKLNEGLDAEKLRQIGEEIRSQPDWAQQLRSNEQALKLLGLTGDIPTDRREANFTHISVNVLMLSDDEHQNVHQMPALEAQVVGDEPYTDADPTIARQRSEQ